MAWLQSAQRGAVSLAWVARLCLCAEQGAAARARRTPNAAPFLMRSFSPTAVMALSNAGASARASDRRRGLRVGRGGGEGVR